jgi:predicted lipoprotein with Yx(FWY)xxD motif
LKRSTMILPAAVAVAALGTAGLAEAGGGKAKLQLRNTKKAGKILANGAGFTLYMFTKDKPNKDNCNPTCQRVWPPATTTGNVSLGKGVKRSLVGTITLPNGKKQITYAKHPLYTYIADGGPGETRYIGVFQSGGRWYALNGAGHLVKHTKK